MKATPRPPGEMVVAGACLAQRVSVSALPQRANRLWWRDAGDRLQSLGNVRAGDAEEA